MNIDIARLKNVRTRGQKTTAQCPACAEQGHDKSGEHLIVWPDGRIGCVVYPGHTRAATEHRTRIFALYGTNQFRPLIVRKMPLGRLGRVKSGILGRLGRVSKTLARLEGGQSIKEEGARVYIKSPAQASSTSCTREDGRPNIGRQANRSSKREAWLYVAKKQGQQLFVRSFTRYPKHVEWTTNIAEAVKLTDGEWLNRIQWGPRRPWRKVFGASVLLVSYSDEPAGVKRWKLTIYGSLGKSSLTRVP